MLFGACWMPRSSNTATLSAPAMRRAAARIEVLVDAAALARSRRRRRRAKRGDHGLGARRRARRGTRRRRGPPARGSPTSAARHQASRARPHPQVEVGELGRVGDDRVDHDHRPLGVLGDLPQHDAGAREALRHPRVLADEDGHLGVLELAARVAAVQLVRRPRPRRSSPGPARSSGTATPSALQEARRCRRRRGGCPGRRRRSRRSTRRRARRGSARSRRRPRRSPCPSRSPRRCRRAAGAAARSGGGGRSGSGRGASPCCTCSPATPGAPCRRGSVEGPRRRAGPRSRSCTRRGCRRSGAQVCASALIAACTVAELRVDQPVQLALEVLERRRGRGMRG